MNQQNIDKVVVFDIWGDYAHFRRFYTTTSPLTFPIPPRTALCGLIGAMIGLEKENNEYLQFFTIDKAFIGLRLLSPVKKVIIAENLIHTKKAKGIGMNLIVERCQIRFEFLKDPKYRIYFYHTDKDLYKKMKNNLECHKSVYTPCFGLSENIANFKFINEFKIETKIADEKYIQIHSILSAEKIADKDGIKFNLDDEFFSIRVPMELNTERIVTKYSDILFEKNGRPIEAKLISRYWTINYGEKHNIVFI
ncbi:MAG: type I-B CRISPR-associated protein Cas5 [Methanosarcinales archaeon]|nr:type I-B CRISPR-associated protein Cas5 [Methanosarcinales archaeon]